MYCNLERNHHHPKFSTTMSIIPPELQDMVVDFSWDDPATLASCCLVCRAWLHPGRIHLFRRIELPLDFPLIVHDIIDILEGPPIAFSSVVCYVRELELSRAPFKMRRYDRNGTSYPVRQSWSQEYMDALAEVFLRLTRVERLELSLNSDGGYRNLMSLITASFSNVSHLRLARFRFQYLYELYSFIQAFPALSSLDLQSVRWSKAVAKPSTNNSPALSSSRRERCLTLYDPLFDTQVEILSVSIGMMYNLCGGRGSYPMVTAGYSGSLSSKCMIPSLPALVETQSTSISFCYRISLPNSSMAASGNFTT